MQDNGNVWRKYRVVPRAYPSHPLICAYFHRVGNKERFRLPGAGGGSFPLYGGTFARSYSVSTILLQNRKVLVPVSVPVPVRFLGHPG